MAKESLALFLSTKCKVCDDRNSISVPLTDTTFEDIVCNIDDNTICPGCGYPSAFITAVYLVNLDDSNATYQLRLAPSSF